MKHIQRKLSYIDKNPLISELFSENSIFFDIETTGFSSAKASVYLIGCLHRKASEIIIDQFFAESKEQEKELLLAFTDFIKPYETLLSFNGIGFDIPFIKGRCQFYDLQDPFQNFSYIDIFKQIGGIKFLLNLPDYKQKTIEQFLDIAREDKFHGGELISVYEEYVKTPSSQAEEVLLLHNYEDVTGMPDILPVLSYSKILTGSYVPKDAQINTYTDYHGKSRSELILTLEHEFPVPKPISYRQENYYLLMQNHTTKLRVSIYEGELKYFYPNYKEYYYLPVEDMAIHQSVAEFVDKKYRQKAKANNCYTKKTGTFLPQHHSLITPAFKKEYKDKVSYFEPTKEFLSSQALLHAYAKELFEIMSK